MVMTHTEPAQKLKAALDRFETCLDTPVMAGELIGWVDALQAAWSDFTIHVRQHLVELHPRLYQQIANQDPELLPRTEKLRAEDAEIAQERDTYDRLLHHFAEHAPKFEPDEEKIASQATSLVDKGIALVNRVRKQEVAVQTWFVEAFTRDCGVAD
jgi:hypothetical protein